MGKKDRLTKVLQNSQKEYVCFLITEKFGKVLKTSRNYKAKLQQCISS